MRLTHPGTIRLAARALVGALALLTAAATSGADPFPGTYTSPNRGGNVQLGRAAVARPFVNSGLPKVFNGQSWDGASLGAQWEIRCGVETVAQAPDVSLFNSSTGTGVITYHQTFNGGTFSLYSVGGVGWGSGSGTLNTTAVVTQVQLVSNVPVASSFTAVTSGQFDIGCTLTFAMSNGFGVGETPYLSKPATYPAFLAADCSPADLAHQFGTWGDVNDIVVSVNADCATSSHRSTWGQVKTLYR